MSNDNVSKIDLILNVLQNGEEISAKQIRSRFGLTTTNSARALISNLRSEGFAIYANKHTDSKGRVVSKYRLGTPSRQIIAAGIEYLRTQGINALG